MATEINGGRIERLGKTSDYMYHPTDFVNRGAYGAVYRARLTTRGDFSGKDYIAVKVVHKTAAEAASDDWQEIRDRWKTLLNLSNIHLVAYHSIRIQMAHNGPASIEFMMDYCNGGDLQSMLKTVHDGTHSLAVHEAVCYSVQIANGLSYLHGQKIIHGDVKPLNVLVQHTITIHKTLVLADLDDTVKMHGNVTSPRDLPTFCGTARYMSPEMLQRFFGVDNTVLIGRKTDIWSAGCMMLELISLAFAVNKDMQWLQNEKQERIALGNLVIGNMYAMKVLAGWDPVVPESFPEPVAFPMRRCLIREPSNRISAGDLEEGLREAMSHFVSTLPTETATKVQQCFCINPSALPEYQMSNYSAHAVPNAAQVTLKGIDCEYHYSKDADFLTRGTMSDIYTAKIEKRGSGLPAGYRDVFAVKVIHMNQKLLDKKRFVQKWEMLLKLQHEHVVVFHKVTITKALGGKTSVEFMMDYCNGGDLGAFLNQLRSGTAQIDLLTAACYTLQIALGLQYLHRKYIIHGDLKPRNVFIKPTKAQHHTLMIGDLDDYMQVFGMESAGLQQKVSGIWGGLGYMAPEMIKKLFGSGDDVVGPETDIWSLGCLFIDLVNRVVDNKENRLYNVLTGECIAVPSNVPNSYFALKSSEGFIPSVPASFPDLIANCIRECLCTNVATRIAVDSLIDNLENIAKDIGQSSSQSMDGCLNCPCHRIWTKNVVLVVEHYNSSATYSSVRALLFDPPLKKVCPLSIPELLHGQVVLQNTVVHRSKVICHVKSGGDFRRINTVAWDTARQSSCVLGTNDFNMTCALVVEERMYFWNQYSRLSPLQFLDLVNGAITLLPTPLKKTKARLARHANKIFCIAEDDCEKWAQCFDTSTNQWESLPEMPQPRTHYAIIQHGCHLYVLGGFISVDGYPPVQTPTCLRLHVVSWVWESVKDLTRPRSHHGAFALDGSIYVLGGNTENTPGELPTAEIYNAETNIWKDCRLATDGVVDAGVQPINSTTCLVLNYPVS